MWKEKRGDKWRFKERYRDPLTGKLKYVSVTMETGSRQSIKEASAVLNHKIDEIMARYSSEGILDEVLLGRLIDEYLAYYKNRVRSSTYYSHVTTLKNFEKEIGSDALIANITPELITEFIESLLYRPDPISNSYASRYKNHIGQLFKFAKKKNYLLNNPVEKVELTYRNDEIKSSTANKFLEEEELQSFLEEAYSRNETYAQLCEWLYQTGTRFGESASLSFDDVYKKDGKYYLKITGTLDYNHIPIELQSKTSRTKTAAGMRTIILSPRAVEIYKQREIEHGNDPFIFSTSNQTPIQTTAINTFLRGIKKDLKINKPLSSHIFRHTHISKLAELGVPLYVIQQRVGHNDSRITNEIYLHVTEKAMEKVIPALDKL
ncbi:tyrosine-type recombinase/integrase [Limosilactobacillus equigenerosi]|uniref:Integrase n=1 Tax=Limosilactobacillus equigenerosi DSM 18793 = JCM 14505 TaxID=1423742 RepID=A0A0R1UL47_9LACO|nr:site-specific integrase [Limosilactobacillus equigenerosi]KRL93917.1 hypothetical protein FC21_GL001388 [Limosilactobacillus equigenerosi DSM 18793 = JCM 14505]